MLKRYQQGPCLEIGLAEGSSLIAIEIPQSHTAPHVHKDGRIYRRVGDSSEPKAETDRFILDQLWRRADDIRNMMRKWIERDPELSDTEGEQSYVRIFVWIANTYGGWLFLGIQERSSDEPVAGSFPGIPDTEIDNALQRLRQSVAEHLNPTPYLGHSKR